MLLKESINQKVEQYLKDKNLYLIESKVSTDNHVLIVIDSFQNVSLDDCVALNKFFEHEFDREVEDYELEISSSGLTEPFKVLNQYQKALGKEIEVLTLEGKKLTGVLISADDEEFIIEVHKLAKPEGKKRKTRIKELMHFKYNEIKYTTNKLRF